MKALAPTPITPALLRRWALPAPSASRGKEARGRVLAIGGSDRIPGGIILAALAALRAGAGTLQIATSRNVSGVVAATVPEACVFGLGVNGQGELSVAGLAVLRKHIHEPEALVVGPGMANPAAAITVVERLLRRGDGPKLVVDAAGLHAFTRRTKRRGPGYRAGIILTPHAGEMASICGLTRKQIEAEPVKVAKETAARLGAVVVLKGADTAIAGPDGTVFLNNAGNPGLGTSGSGDTLSGVIAGLCARGVPALQAAVWGVHLHARAGDKLARDMGPLGYLARELLAEIPALMAKLSK